MKPVSRHHVLSNIASLAPSSANAAPVASNVAFTVASGLVANTPETGSPITGSYTYSDADSDAEGTSTFRWLRDDVAIEGATGSTYTPVAADVGHALKFEVTPVAATGTTPGTAVASAASENVCTCYYVDAAAANDLGAGTSPATAWKTITKVNASSFSAGNRIRFNRGQTWSGVGLVIPSSGSVGNYVRFRDYGSGALPSIVGADSATNTVQMNNKSYVELANLDIGGSASSNHCIGGNDISFITITGCKIHNAGVYFGINFDGAAISNITITDNLVYSNKMSGIVLEYSAQFLNGPNDCLVEGNTCYSNGTSVNSDHGIYLNTRNSICRNNTCYDNKGAGIKINSSVDTIVERNYCYSTTQGLQNFGVIMGKEAAPAVCQGNTIRNNKMYLNVYGLYLGGGINVANTYYHNTIVNSCNAAKNNGYSIWIGANVANQVIKNNIAIQDQAVVNNYKDVYFIAAADLPNNTINYNCVVYGDTAHFAEVGTQKTYAEWQALTGTPDANSVNSDPVFVANYTDLHIQTSSPCKNAGATGLGVTTDYDGVTRDASPDIGAYEYV